jgi:hypothetical protein
MNMKKVEVYDAIMGSGKTYNAIERMNEYVRKGKKFIYITPFLSEVKRIKDSLPELPVSIPLDPKESKEVQIELDIVSDNGVYDLNVEKKFTKLNKRGQFIKFVTRNDNVVATHSLFKSLKKEDYSLFKDYILILDEVVDPLELQFIGERDIDILVEQNLIAINEKTSQVRFIDEEYIGRFEDVKRLCNTTTVFYLDKHFFAWIFPIEIFKSFKEVQILTYLFKGSLMCAYFKLFNVDFIIHDNNKLEELIEFKLLLNIYEGLANEKRDSTKSFSLTWCKKTNKTTAKKISYKTSNIFKKKFCTPSKYNAFTVFKDFQPKFSGGGYSKGFIPVNSRATNEFSHKKSMAYLANKIFHPQHVNFFRERGVELDLELYALGELVQWIWRGCIRNKEKMNLYIPSYRMRTLLTRWLEGEFLDPSYSQIKR